MTLTFTVPGIPIPQGSKKAFVIKRRAVIVDDNAATLKPWRNTVKLAAQTAGAGSLPLEGALFVLLDFTMPRPKTVKRLRPHVKPDIDKLTRAILDALTDSKVIGDDGQIVSLHVEQWYGIPSVTVKVGELA